MQSCVLNLSHTWYRDVYILVLLGRYIVVVTVDVEVSEVSWKCSVLCIASEWVTVAVFWVAVSQPQVCVVSCGTLCSWGQLQCHSFVWWVSCSVLCTSCSVWCHVLVFYGKSPSHAKQWAEVWSFPFSFFLSFFPSFFLSFLLWVQVTVTLGTANLIFSNILKSFFESSNRKLERLFSNISVKRVLRASSFNCQALGGPVTMSLQIESAQEWRNRTVAEHACSKM